MRGRCPCFGWARVSRPEQGVAGQQAGADAIFSPPADEVTDKGDEWQVVVEGASSGRPSVLFAEYGSGKILVELGHPTSDLLCRFDNDAVVHYVECTRRSAVPTHETGWSAIKAQFR